MSFKLKIKIIFINLWNSKHGIRTRIKNISPHKHTVVSTDLLTRLCQYKTYNVIRYSICTIRTSRMRYKNIIHIVVPMKKYDVNLTYYINKLRKMDFQQENLILFNAQSRTCFINTYITDNINRYHNMTPYKDLTTFPSINPLTILLLTTQQLTIKRGPFPLYQQLDVLPLYFL